MLTRIELQRSAIQLQAILQLCWRQTEYRLRESLHRFGFELLFAEPPPVTLR